MPALDPAERSELARLAVLTRWSRTKNRTAATQEMRDKFRARFDPGPEVPEPTRSKMIAAGVEAHMLRMRRAKAKVAAARRELDELTGETDDAEAAG